jgi:uncharacterized protein YwqG
MLAYSSTIEQVFDFFRQHKKTAIDLDYIKLDKDNVLLSKIGGIPYMPQGFVYPTYDNLHYTFICQFNLADVYQKVGKTLLPESGMLQFFVINDYFFGGEPCKKEHISQVIYHPVVDLTYHCETPDNIAMIHHNPYLKDYDFMPLDQVWQFDFSSEELMLPLDDDLAITHALQHSYADFDYRTQDLHTYFFPDIRHPDKQELWSTVYDDLDTFNNHWESTCNYLLGYAKFMQCDYATIDSQTLDKDYVTLLELYADEPLGDMLLNWRIPKANLLKQDFSHILMHMDCT